MLVANGRWSVGVIAFIAPVLLVRYVRTRTLGRALGGGIAILSIANYVWWRGVFPLSGVSYAIASIVLGVVTLIPYLFDRRYAPRIGGALGTLVLPCAAVALELLHSAFSPFGSWGSYAYAQHSHGALLQLVSITGLTGVTFLVLWFASIVNDPSRSIAIAYAAIFGAVILFGALRTTGTSETVTIAAITPRVPTYTADVISGFRSRSSIDDGLLAATAAEASRGAKLVVWSEGAGIVDRNGEAALIERAASVAVQQQIWIELAYLVVGEKRYENKNVLVDSSGATVWSYNKAHPVPLMESCRPGDGRIPVAPTPFGRVATVICFDADFPRLVHQAGAQGADILLIPADDWREIAPLHATMARFRAIEQGVSIVRATSSGFSTVIDRFGRVRASADYFSGVRTLRAEVPSRGVQTIYSRFPDLFAIGCVALFALLVAAAEFPSVRVDVIAR